MTLDDRIEITRLELVSIRKDAKHIETLVNGLDGFVERLEDAYEKQYGKSIDLSDTLDTIYECAINIAEDSSIFLKGETQ